MTMPTGHTSGAPDFEAATAWRASQVEEYSQWVAVGDIYHGNALAYTAGDPVPASNVAEYNYDVDGLVRRPDGWTDPVPGDNIEDAPAAEIEDAPAAEALPAGESNVDTDASTVDDGGETDQAVKRTSNRKR